MCHVSELSPGEKYTVDNAQSAQGLDNNMQSVLEIKQVMMIDDDDDDDDHDDVNVNDDDPGEPHGLGRVHLQGKQLHGRGGGHGGGEK